MCKQITVDIDSCLLELDKIFNEEFLPETKKKTFYKDARYISTLDRIYSLKKSLISDDIRKNLIWLCEMYQGHAEKESARRWNVVVYFCSAAAIFASLIAVISDSYETNLCSLLVILVASLVFVAMLCAYQASHPTTREAFYALVVKILKDDTESSAIPPMCPNNDCKTSTGDTSKENK